jgi:hypothetical protein
LLAVIAVMAVVIVPTTATLREWLLQPAAVETEEPDEGVANPGPKEGGK